MRKFLIIGHAQHGKDTTAEIMEVKYGLTFESSSVAASRIFLYDKLKEKYGYVHPIQCFVDRINHRKEWHDLICEYNLQDKARLAKEIMKNSDMYVGMRSFEEIKECKEQGVFDLVIGVFDPRKPLEDRSSFNIDVFQEADIIIPNAGSFAQLIKKVQLLTPLFT